MARKFNLCIFSLDSLSIYKTIDIASAKPTRADLEAIRHFGINVLNPSENCNAMLFSDLLREAVEKVGSENILIVGGSGFYLKSIIDGLSPAPKSSAFVEAYIAKIARNRAESYKLLSQIDPAYAQKIAPNDSFRIFKGLEIFLLTNQTPSAYFMANPRQKPPFNFRIFELVKPREVLRESIKVRTAQMFENGLINEVRILRTNFPQSHALKAIGIKEIIEFLDGKITLESAQNAIIKNTLALAKRQRTFNRTQFGKIAHLEADALFESLAQFYAKSPKMR